MRGFTFTLADAWSLAVLNIVDSHDCEGEGVPITEEAKRHLLRRGWAKIGRSEGGGTWMEPTPAGELAMDALNMILKANHAIPPRRGGG